MRRQVVSLSDGQRVCRPCKCRLQGLFLAFAGEAAIALPLSIPELDLVRLGVDGVLRRIAGMAQGTVTQLAERMAKTAGESVPGKSVPDE